MSTEYYRHALAPLAFGNKGRAVSPSVSADLAPAAKGIVVASIAGGDVLRVLPFGNADDAWLTFTGVAVGFSPPYVVRRVHTDTTCTVHTIED